MIYLDHASTSLPKPTVVIDAVAEAMQSVANSGRGAHGASLEAGRVLFSTRMALAELFHAADPSRIAFSANATESLNTVIKGLFHPGDHVITTQWEHNSVLRPLYEMGSLGLEMSVVPSDDQGFLYASKQPTAPQLPGCAWRGTAESIFGPLVRSNTKAVICTHASNLTGNLSDLKALGRFCQERDLLLIVDAAQTAGVFPIDVQAMNISILCFTGHKGLQGPQGTGGLYVRKGVHLRPLKTGGSGIMTFSRVHPEMMPEALEAGTQNVHGLAGLLVAINYLLQEGMDELRQREQALAWQFYQGVAALENVTIYGDFRSSERAAIVALNVGDEDSGWISDTLAQEFSIYTRPGGHCAPLMHEALGTRDRGAVRFSFSHSNNEKDVAAAVAAVRILSQR